METEKYEVVELFQHHLESFEDAYWEAREKIKREQVGRSTDEGLTIRAAFSAGWFGDQYKIDVAERVANMTPRMIVEIATKANQAREVARHIDPFLVWRLVNMSLAKQHHHGFFARLGGIKPGEALTIQAGGNGKLEVLSALPTPQTFITPVTDTNEQQVTP